MRGPAFPFICQGKGSVYNRDRGAERVRVREKIFRDPAVPFGYGGPPVILAS